MAKSLMDLQQKETEHPVIEFVLNHKDGCRTHLFLAPPMIHFSM